MRHYIHILGIALAACHTDLTVGKLSVTDTGAASDTGDASTADTGGPPTTGGSEAPGAPPVLEWTLSPIKQFHFSWTPIVAGAYHLWESADVGLPYVQVGEDIAADVTTVALTVPLHARLNASYVVRGCTGMTCSESEPVTIGGSLTGAIGYVKASNTGAGDSFGRRVALSADGNTMAVSAVLEDSAAIGIDGDQADDAAVDAGAVYVFVRTNDGWSQQAYVKASNPGEGDQFGGALALSADGDTLAVGARREASEATGIDGDPLNNAASHAGAAYVFVRVNDAWSQQAYVKASNTDDYNEFGASIALSADGDTLAIGAIFEDSAATGIDGDQADDSASGAGAAYVFVRKDGAWSQRAYVKASNPGINDHFGASVTLSADGTTLAVGAVQESSEATGVDGDQANDEALAAGAVYVYVQAQNVWSQQAYVKAPDSFPFDNFGASVALSADGDTLAVGAIYEASAAGGIGQGQNNVSAPDAGAVYVYVRASGIWSAQEYIKASNTGQGDRFGGSIALSADGNILAVGADGEDSEATGVGGEQDSDGFPECGAVYVYIRRDDIWSQRSYVKASDAATPDGFGHSVALSGDGDTLVVGAPNEDSASVGVGGEEANHAALSAGAVYLY
ncbi:hypothetical protein [Nannocystis sp.]|uniref:hypothetical protein n=1 Tax=Nannocystis sp. TaxID=1962667 RepID=UPI0025F95402|nr:hypothetical protein [Nannocystis sp.]MBK7827370.1 integrin [Nannocystis sp.]